VVGGIYKGIKEVKKEGGSAAEGKSSLVFDSSLVRQLLESNNQLTDVNREIASILRAIQHRLDHSVEATQDHRNIVRSQIEEQHRLRAAIVDLIELLRRR
jgi:seryl-tRNA synthetase